MMKYTNTQVQTLKNNCKAVCCLLLLAISLNTQAQNAILTTIFEDDFEDSNLVDPVTNFKPQWTPRPNLTGFDGIVDRLLSFQGITVGFDGSKGVAMTKSTDAGSFTTNALDLELDLSPYANADKIELSFYIGDIVDDTHAQDGIFFKKPDGDFVKVYAFDPSSWNSAGKFPPIDIKALAESASIPLDENFVIRFQQYGVRDFTISFERDGFILDNVMVYIPNTTYVTLPFEDNFDTDLNFKLKPMWTHADAFLKGNTTLTTSSVNIRPDGIVSAVPSIQIISAVGHNNSLGAVVLGRTSDGSLTTNALDLHLNLSEHQGAEEVLLEFWMWDYSEENYPQQGIFFSNDAGKTFKKIYDFFPESIPNSYQFYELNIAQLASNISLSPVMTLTDSCVIRFQHHGRFDFSGASGSSGDGGFIIDDVKVYAPGLPVAVVSSNQGTNICAGTSVTFTANITNPGTTATFQWLRNGFNVGVNANTYTTAALDSADVIEVIYQANNGLSTSAPVVMNVLPIKTPSVLIAANEGVVCSNANNILRAIPTNGGINPTYRWYLNDVVQNTTLTENPERSFASLKNGDKVRVQMFFTLPCSSIAAESINSTDFTITLTPTQTPTINLQSTISSGETICNGEGLQFSTTSTFAGQNPEYTWFLNGNLLATTPNNSFPINTFLPNATNTVRVRLNSSYPCVPQNADTLSTYFTVITQSSITPSVNVLSSVGFDLCPEQFVTLEAQSTGGGFAPLYQWFVNDVPATNLSTANRTFPTTTLQNDDVIKVTMVSTSPCPLPQTVSSAPQIIQVIEPEISIITSPIVCIDQPTPTFTAEFSGGGTNPVFQWFINGQPRPNNNAEPFKFTFLEPIGNGGQTIRVRITPSGNCGANVFAFSQTLTISVLPTAPTSVSITSQVGSGQAVCVGEYITFTASSVNAGQNAIYKWIVEGDTLQSGTSNTFSTNAFVANQINKIQVKMISSQPCASPVEKFSGIYEIFARESITPQVNIQSLDGISVCENELVRFSAVPVGGGVEPLYQWYINNIPQGGFSTNAIFQTLILQDEDIVKVTMLSSLTCASLVLANSNQLTMQIRPAPRVEISSDSDIENLCDNFTVNFTAIPSNAGANPTFQWRKDGQNIIGATNPTLTLSNQQLTNQSNIDVVMTTTVNCKDPIAISNPINIQVDNNFAPQISIKSSQGFPICQGGDAIFEVEQFIPADLVNDANATYVWKVNGNIIPNSNTRTFNAGILQNGNTVQLEYTTTVSCANPKTVNSNTLTVNTQALNAANNLSVTASGTNRIDVSWSDNSSNETGFRIERSVGNDTNFQFLITKGSNETFHSDQNVTAGTLYFYRVRALNGNIQGCVSAYTSAVGAATDDGEIITALPKDRENGFKVFPNPSQSGIFQLHWLTEISGNIHIEVFNLMNAKVFDANFDKSSLDKTTSVDISKQSAGMYYLKVSYQDKQYFVRVVRE